MGSKFTDHQFMELTHTEANTRGSTVILKLVCGVSTGRIDGRILIDKTVKCMWSRFSTHFASG